MKIKILLFDDIAANREEVKRAIAIALDGDGDVVEFAPGTKSEGTHEDRLAEALIDPANASVDLIVADRDLSSYTDEFRGLSEPTVRRVADALGIPECGYARGERTSDPDYVRHAEQREACIRLSLRPLDDFAKRAVAIAKGFQTIGEQLKNLKPDRPSSSLAKVLASILGKPQYSDKISLYASGDQSRLQAVHGILSMQDPEQKRRRMTCLLGYWLWDSVLRFPGVTVGVIPASSHLNIEEDVFRQDQQVQNVFSTALYQGPFADAKIKMWWRGMLDDMIAESECSDGLEFATKQLRRGLPKSKCCEEPSLSAGYYCMLKEKPVSLKNSKGSLPWFPRGADLARVSKSKLEELGPWL